MLSPGGRHFSFQGCFHHQLSANESSGDLVLGKKCTWANVMSSLKNKLKNLGPFGYSARNDYQLSTKSPPLNDTFLITAAHKLFSVSCSFPIWSQSDSGFLNLNKNADVQFIIIHNSNSVTLLSALLRHICSHTAVKNWALNSIKRP